MSWVPGGSVKRPLANQTQAIASIDTVKCISTCCLPNSAHLMLPHTLHRVINVHHRQAGLCQWMNSAPPRWLCVCCLCCPEHHQVVMTVLQGWQASMPWDTNPLYAIMHESIYCNSGSCNWAAHRIREVSACFCDLHTSFRSCTDLFFTCCV